MKAMIFAAGRGERMRPLTDTCPKPLLKVRGRPLITWHVLNLVRAGIVDIVINHSHLGHMIEAELGDGSRYGARIVYSHEPSPLETAGGVANALHLLGDEPFLAVSGDIYAPYFDFTEALDALKDKDAVGQVYAVDQRDIAWLWLTPNPWHNPEGDFALDMYTLRNEGDVKFGPLMRQYIEQGRIGGEVYHGQWVNVGTVGQLEELNAPLRSAKSAP
jgi:MurNAc alpha-1-phosphate uridylyltransferase